MFTVKGNKIQLGFNNKYPENNQRVPKTALNVEKTVQMSGFNTVHLVKFIGKGCSIFFRVLMLRYLVLQDIKH